MPIPRIYLDHAATTPIRPEARAAVVEGMARWANPSSPHAEGRVARAALEGARARIAAALGWPGEVVLTSGASEALAIALGRAKVERRLISAVEHDAVLRAAPTAERLPMQRGEVDPEHLAAQLRRRGSAIVAIQHVNSETGTVVLPFARNPAVELVRQVGGLLLGDCSQSAGKLPLADADMIVVSAHKLGGPPGIGALLVRDLAMLAPGGGQEAGYRGGTENLPGALGFAAALEAGGTESWASTAEDRVRFRDALGTFGEVVQPGVQCSNIVALTLDGASAATQLMKLDMLGFAVSAGSACSSGSLKRSRTLEAFGLSGDEADRTIRISLGWTTTVEELDAFLDALATTLRRSAAA